MDGQTLSSLFGLNTGGGGATLGDIATATSSATSGAVTTGDRILGGNRSSRQIGIIKLLAIFAGSAILYKIYKSGRK